MKQLNKKIISTSILFVILSIWFNILYVRNESFAATDEDIYDVVLFWGQSNMAGRSRSNKEDRYEPLDEASVEAYSKETGIDKEILTKNGTNRNEITIPQEKGTVFEYLYSKNDLQEINSNTKALGEILYYQYDSKGNLTKLGTDKNESNLAAMGRSSGINMIPEFGNVWYKNTGHKLVAVFCAWGGQRIERFLPTTDPNYPTANKRYMYEAIKTKWDAAITYLNKNNYKIGNKLYVACQGEANINDSMTDYKNNFKKVHDNMKKDLGITTGAIVETGTKIGSKKLVQVNNKHNVYKELINENTDIILGSSYAYDRYVPTESQYSSCNTKVCYDSNGNKLTYAKALERASKSVDYDTNTIHFTAAALSQMGKEAAESLSEINSIKLSKEPNKKKYIQNYEKLDVSGGKIIVDYSNIKDDVIALDSKMVNGFDNSKVGSQTLTVTYKGKSTTFNVEIKEKEPTDIKIVELPQKTEYIQDYENLDVKGGKIQITYNDTSTEIIDITNEMVSNFDNSKIGSQTLTITYKGKSTTFNVEIKEKELTDIKIVELPQKTEYIQNYENLDVKGGKIQITYNYTITEVIDITDEMVSNFDNSKLGTQTLTVTYKGLTTQYNIVVNQKEVDTIKWKEKPAKIEYIQNYEKLDVKSGKIQVIYNDKSEEVIDLTEEMVSGFDNTVLGTRELIVKYHGKVLSYDINIVSKKVIDISVYKKPTNMVYIQNYGTLDVTGGQLYVRYNDNSNTVIDMTNEMVTGFDNTKIGKNVLTIKYAGVNTDLEVEIVAKEIVNIELEEKPIKTKYIQNYDELNVTGGILKVVYNDNTTENINLTKEMVDGFDNSKLGQQTLMIKYGNMSVEYSIEIIKKSVVKIEIYKQPDKKEYLQNDKVIDVTGGKINVIYDDKTTEIIDMTSDMITGFDSTVLGTIEVTVNYAGKTDNYNIKINPVVEKKPADEKSENNKEQKNDDTIAKDILPKAGIMSYILGLIVLINVVIISYIGYTKNKDI